MITTTLQGRLGNQFYQIAMLLAYCKKYDLEYYIPDKAYHCDGTKMYFPHLANGPELQGLQEYHEQPVHALPNGDGTFKYNVPVYQDIPLMDNTKFVGYWQTFKYFNSERFYILDKFQLPYKIIPNSVGIHCRYGDFTQLRDKHPEVPANYYITAVEYFIAQGYINFIVFSDDIRKAMIMFETVRWSCPITFYAMEGEERTEIRDLTELSSTEHQILCYSTFGFIAAWLNRNPNKQVIIPPARYCFSGAHQDFISSTFTQLEFEQ